MSAPDATPPDLTVTELVDRWRLADGSPGVTAGTLANWRSKRIGPPFRKLGTRITYPVAGVVAYEAQRTIDTRWWKPAKAPAPVSAEPDPWA